MRPHTTSSLCIWVESRIHNKITVNEEFKEGMRSLKRSKSSGGLGDKLRRIKDKEKRTLPNPTLLRKLEKEKRMHFTFLLHSFLTNL
jgi:hypothetical protein